MTLITNEIHMLDGFQEDGPGIRGRPENLETEWRLRQLAKKAIQNPLPECGHQLFRLGTGFPNGRRQYLSDWLPVFIRKNSGAQNLGDFSSTLRDELHKIVPSSVLGANASGFHIGGYNAQGIPEFWFLTNIGGMDDFRYKDLAPRYSDPSSDFLRRDAVKLGWDGTNPASVASVIQIYRNGDFRAHVAAWEKLDGMLAQLLGFPDFRNPRPRTTWENG